MLAAVAMHARHGVDAASHAIYQLLLVSLLNQLLTSHLLAEKLATNQEQHNAPRSWRRRETFDDRLAPAPISRGIKHEHGGNAKGTSKMGHRCVNTHKQVERCKHLSCSQPIRRAQGLLQYPA